MFFLESAGTEAVVCCLCQPCQEGICASSAVSLNPEILHKLGKAAPGAVSLALCFFQEEGESFRSKSEEQRSFMYFSTPMLSKVLA